MQQRIHLVAKLLVQGMTQREIAERAGLDPLSLKVMCCRRKAELQTAVSELKSMGSLMP
jgi:Trp operon repressor